MKLRDAVQAEQLKHRHRKIFILPVIFLVFQFVWALWNLEPKHSSDIAQGYLCSFYYFPIINSLLYPTFIGVLTNRICDMEIKGDTFKLLYTLQNEKHFYACKYLTGLKYLFTTALFQMIMIVCIGNIYHFSDTLSPHMFLQYGLSTFVVSAALLSIQQMLSLRSHNQILPLTVGLAGSFLSLFSLFFPKAISRLILWGYYGNFLFVQMDWDKMTRISTYYESSFNWSGFLLFTLFGVIIYFICQAITLRKEV